MFILKGHWTIISKRTCLQQQVIASVYGIIIAPNRYIDSNGARIQWHVFGSTKLNRMYSVALLMTDRLYCMIFDNNLRSESLSNQWKPMRCASTHSNRWISLPRMMIIIAIVMIWESSIVHWWFIKTMLTLCMCCSRYYEIRLCMCVASRLIMRRLAKSLWLDLMTKQ